jgi:glucose dehydrogenase
MFRAHHSDTGEVLWSAALPDGSEGIPASYEVNGRQYIALPVAAGAGLFAPRLNAGDAQSGERYYVVFALSRR